MLKAAKEVFSRVVFSKRWVWILFLKDYMYKISETVRSNQRPEERRISISILAAK